MDKREADNDVAFHLPSLNYSKTKIENKMKCEKHNMITDAITNCPYCELENHSHTSTNINMTEATAKVNVEAVVSVPSLKEQMNKLCVAMEWYIDFLNATKDRDEYNRALGKVEAYRQVKSFLENIEDESNQAH